MWYMHNPISAKTVNEPWQVGGEFRDKSDMDPALKEFTV